MIELIRDFFAWVGALPVVHAYLMLLLVAYGENLLPPVPGDALIVFAGYLVSVGKLDPVVSVALAAFGGTLGFMTMYAVGRRIEGALLDPTRFRWIPKQRLNRALGWIQRKGYLVVAANRFLSGLRSVIALASGMARLTPLKTVICSCASATVWSTLMVLFGYVLGENWERVNVGVRRYSAVVTVLILAFIVVQFIRYRRDRGAT